MEGNTELRAAQSILERGIWAEVKAPLFLRLFGKKTLKLKVRKLYAGTLLHVAECYLSTGIKEEQLKEIESEAALELMAKHGRAICKAVAMAILNDKWKIRWLSGWLAGYLLRHLDWMRILKMLEFALVYNGTVDFMSTTRLVRAMKITDPANQGQTKKATKRGS